MPKRRTLHRGEHQGYNDMRERRVLWRIPLALLMSFVIGSVLLAAYWPFASLAVPRDSAWASPLYLASIPLNSVFIYATSVTGILLGFSITMPRLTSGVLNIVREGRNVLIDRFLGALLVNLFISVSYWAMIQSVDIIAPPIGMWLIQSLVTSAFAMSAAYRAYRYGVTLDAGIEALISQEQERRRGAGFFSRAMSAMIPKFGDGHLVSPLIQSLLVILATLLIFTGVSGVIDPVTFSSVFMLAHMLLLTVWAIGYRLVDGFKPWGECGRLSAIRIGETPLLAPKAAK